MKIWEAVVLGLVQGLGEFLPVSSSGHLILARELMDISGDYLTFDVMLHAATLAAVFAAFFKPLLGLFKPPFKRLGLVALASVPAAAAGILFAKFGGGAIESARYLCFFFLASAVILFAGSYLAKRVKEPRPVGLPVAAAMGLMQAAAVLPGVTRSGSTICGGLAAGGDRNDTAQFSFFMSVPVILGAAVFQLFGDGSGVPVEWYCYAIGMLTAAVSGFLAIKLMLKVIAKADFKWFALYLTALSVFTFVFYFL